MMLLDLVVLVRRDREGMPKPSEGMLGPTQIGHRGLQTQSHTAVTWTRDRRHGDSGQLDVRRCEAQYLCEPPSS